MRGDEEVADPGEIVARMEDVNPAAQAFLPVLVRLARRHPLLEDGFRRGQLTHREVRARQGIAQENQFTLVRDDP